MTAKHTAAAIAKAILLQFFILWISYGPAFACDSDTFVFAEFGQRCQNLAQLIQQLQTSYKMDLPNQEKFRRMLLNEWIDFFLDHGKAPPGGFSQIASDSWRLTLEEAGKQIGLLTYRKIAPGEADAAVIPFDLLAQPIKFGKVREVVASWGSLLKEPEPTTIASESLWLGMNVNCMIQIAGIAAISFPNEKERIKKTVEEIGNEWRFVIEADSEVADTIFRFSAVEIRQKLKREFEHWRKLSFM